MSAAANPFRALRGYTSSSEDQRRFFGRDRDLTLMLDRVLSRRTTLLFAGSGVGKSSFLQARIIPEMSDRYFVALHSRWGQPYLMQSLVESICAGWSASAKEPAPEAPKVLSSDNCLVELYSQLPVTAGLGRLLILDQFEELFQHHSDTQDFDLLILSLAALIRGDDPEVRVVFSMREEFLGELSVFDNLIPDLFNNYYRLKPLTRRQARQIIEGTAKSVGIEASKAVGDLIDDLVRAGDKTTEKVGPRLRDTVAPPFLQIACHGLWNRRPPVKEFPSEYRTGDASRELDQYVRRILDEALSKPQKKLLTDTLAYLITRKGAKIACDAGVLAHQIRVKEEQVTTVLGRLSTDEAKVFRRTQAADGSTWFELYHDMYAPFLSDWRADQLRGQASKRRRTIWTASAVAAVLVMVLGAISMWQASKVGAVEATLQSAQATLQAALNRPTDVFALRTGQHTDRVLDVAYSADGTRLATASADGTAKLWDADTGLSTYTFASGKLLNAVAFAQAANGLSLVTGGADGKVTLIETVTRAPRSFDFGRTVYTIATDASGTQIACAGHANLVKIWRPDGTLAARIETRSTTINTLAFTPDGKDLIAGDFAGRVTRLAASGAGREEEVTRHPVSVLAVAVSPDGRWIASGSRDMIAKLTRLDGSASLDLKGHSSSVRAVAFSPDSKLLVTGGVDGDARIWNVADGTLRARLVGHTGAIYGVAFDPTGKKIASSGQDKTTRIWDVASSNQVEVLEGSWSVPKMAGFVSDLKGVFLSTLDNYASFWQIGRESKEAANFNEGEGVAAIATVTSGDNYAYATRQGKIRVCNSVGKTGCYEAAGVPLIRLLALSGDGRSVAAVAEESNRIQVITTPVATMPGEVTGVQAPAGPRAAIVGRSAQFLALGLTGESLGMANEGSYLFAPATNLKSAGEGRRIIGISYTAGNEGVVLLDDSTALLVGARGERRIEPNDRPTAKAVMGTVADDGRSIAFAYEDGSVRAWDQKGESYQPMISGRRVLALGFSKRATHLGVLDLLGTVRMFLVNGSGTTGGSF